MPTDLRTRTCVLLRWGQQQARCGGARERGSLMKRTPRKPTQARYAPTSKPASEDSGRECGGCMPTSPSTERRLIARASSRRRRAKVGPNRGDVDRPRPIGSERRRSLYPHGASGLISVEQRVACGGREPFRLRAALWGESTLGRDVHHSGPRRALRDGRG